MTAASATTPPISVEESKVLYALLDAADEMGRLSDAVRERWSEAKMRLAHATYFTESALLWELLEELERSGAIANTWIGDRWSTIKRQVERAIVLTKSSSTPSPSHTPPFFARYFR